MRTLATIGLCVDHLAALLAELDETRGAGSIYAPRAVVYYIGDPPSQLIKIGTSTRFAARFNSLKATRPEAVLLAAEPGHFELERARHRQFAGLRFSHKGTQREWYRKHEALMNHVNDLRSLHGDPWQVVSR